MIDGAVDAAFAFLVYVGPPALFVFFLLKGALIGKPLPTTVFLPGYVVAISAGPLEAAGVVLVSSSAYVCGQLLVYAGARRGGRSYVTSSPRTGITEARLRRAEELFDRYGGPGIFLTNFVPYLRGLILIPAGIAAYPAPRVAVYALASTAIYHAAIVAIALGAMSVLR